VSAPAISVVICSYNSRQRIAQALDSLAAQDTTETFEVIVVDSGQDGTSELLASEHPWVRVVRSDRRLHPGPARNRGVEAALGELVAFLPDDGVARSDWLRLRVAKHREGFDAVGGAITNATPWHPVGSAGYYLEYSALIPSDRILAEQAIPHCLSYRRQLFQRLGAFPEDTDTGEDTLFNRRLVERGVRVGYDARIQLGHRNLKGLRDYLAHQYEHGEGLMQCVARHRLRSPIGPQRRPGPALLWRAFVSYPALRWWHALGRLWRGRRAWVPGYLVLAPLVWAGLWATSAGVLREAQRAVSAEPIGQISSGEMTR
jgi:glycosyltransferase involved in cell wall biosynthesis